MGDSYLGLFNRYGRVLGFLLLITFVCCKERYKESIREMNEISQRAVLDKDLENNLKQFMDKNMLLSTSKQIYLIYFYLDQEDTLVSIQKSLKPVVEHEFSTSKYMGGIYIDSLPLLIVDQKNNPIGIHFYDETLLNSKMLENFDYEEYSNEDYLNNVYWEYKIQNNQLKLIKKTN